MATSIKTLTKEDGTIYEWYMSLINSPSHKKNRGTTETEANEPDLIPSQRIDYREIAKKYNSLPIGGIVCWLNTGEARPYYVTTYLKKRGIMIRADYKFNCFEAFDLIQTLTGETEFGEKLGWVISLIKLSSSKMNEGYARMGRPPQS